MRAGLAGVAGEASAGIEVERVGGGDAVLDQAEVDGLSIFLGRFVLFKVLVTGGGLGFGAVGRNQDGDVQQQRPVVVDGVDSFAAGVLGGDYGMESGGLVDVLLVFYVRQLEILQAAEVDVLSDRGGDWAVGSVGVSGDLELMT